MDLNSFPKFFRAADGTVTSASYSISNLQFVFHECLLDFVELYMSTLLVQLNTRLALSSFWLVGWLHFSHRF